MAKGTMSGSTTELQFLNYILNKNSMHAVIINGLTEDNFSLYKEQFNFIKDYYNKYNCMPSRETITGKLYTSPYFEGERLYAYGYDMNSAFSWGMLQDMPKDTEKGPINLDKDKQPIPRILKSDEIGFDIVGNIKYSGELATYIFKKMTNYIAINSFFSLV